MLFFTARKRSLFDLLTKIYLITGSYKNYIVYLHETLKPLPQQKISMIPRIRHFDIIGL